MPSKYQCHCLFLLSIYKLIYLLPFVGMWERENGKEQKIRIPCSEA